MQLTQATKVAGSVQLLGGRRLAAPAAGATRTACAAAPAARAASATKKLKAGAAKVQKRVAKAVPATRKAGGTQRIAKPVQKAAAKVGSAVASGTRRVKAVEMFGDKAKTALRDRLDGSKPAPRLLARVEQLRLLSKLERAGLLSLAERSGLTLSAIEKSGLLSTAESLGLLSAASDRKTPGALYTLAALLFVAGPALVYLTPDDSTPLIALQAVVALLCVAGGSAAYGGAQLLNTLQKNA